MIKTLHQLGPGERLRNECGGRETLQFLRWDWKRVHRVDDRLAFPARQGLRNLAMFPERDRQDDCVGLECIFQRLGDNRGANRPSLRRQHFSRPAARDGHVDVFTGEGLGEGLAYLAESYNCVAHNFSLWFTEPYGPPNSRMECRRASGSDLRWAAVDGEFAGGHEAAVLRREKGSRRSDLRRIGHALERSHRGVDLLALLA